MPNLDFDLTGLTQWAAAAFNTALPFVLMIIAFLLIISTIEWLWNTFKKLDSPYDVPTMSRSRQIDIDKVIGNTSSWEDFKAEASQEGPITSEYFLPNEQEVYNDRPT